MSASINKTHDFKASYIDMIETLDVSIFSKIETQTTENDRLSLLALQRAVARQFGRYTYLEIGSHLGGSIQPHYLDNRCRKIYSIDARPDRQNDSDGKIYYYPDNSTDRLLCNLKSLSEDQLDKVVTFDCDAKDVDPGEILTPPQLCFIDGEHTNEAALSDSEFCLKVLSKAGVIVYHDADHVYKGIKRFCTRLKMNNNRFYAFALPEKIYVIAMVKSKIKDDSTLKSLRKNKTIFYFLSHMRDFYLDHFDKHEPKYLRSILRKFYKKN